MYRIPMFIIFVIIFFIIGSVILYFIIEEHKCKENNDNLSIADDPEILEKSYVNNYCLLSERERRMITNQYKLYGGMMILVSSVFLGYLFSEFFYRYEVCRYKQTNNMFRSDFCM